MYIYICIYIYIYIYSSVLVNEMPKSARYHIDRANSIVLPQKGCHYSLFHPRGIMIHDSSRMKQAVVGVHDSSRMKQAVVATFLRSS